MTNPNDALAIALLRADRTNGDDLDSRDEDTDFGSGQDDLESGDGWQVVDFESVIDGRDEE